MPVKLKTDVAILGAGIGGFEAYQTLRALCRRYGLAKKILLIDQNNYSSFSLLNHEVAAGAVEPTHAALPLRELAFQAGQHFLKASVLSVNPPERLVATDRGTVQYDYCVMALGSATNYFGIPGAEQFSYHVRTLTGAMKLRHNLFAALESEADSLMLTVVGGGYTGVEVAGQFQYLVNHDIRHLYPEKHVSVRLIHGSGTVVPHLPARAQQKIVRRLKTMGVDILFNTRVETVTSRAVVAGGEKLPSDFTIWCAGFANVANRFFPPEFCGPDQRLITNHYLQAPADPSLYGIGDAAHITNPGETAAIPQLGEAAYHAGRYVARHLAAAWRGKTMAPFQFVSQGTLMPIGDRYGIGVIRGVTFSGIFAWWLRRTVYLTFMPGIIRKLRIIIDWTLRLFSFSYIIVVERGKEKGPPSRN